MGCHLLSDGVVWTHMKISTLVVHRKMFRPDALSKNFLPQLLGVELAFRLQLSTSSGKCSAERASSPKVMLLPMGPHTQRLMDARLQKPTHCSSTRDKFQQAISFSPRTFCGADQDCCPCTKVNLAILLLLLPDKGVHHRKHSSKRPEHQTLQSVS